MHILASLGLLLIVLGLSGGAWFFWDRSGDAIIPAGRYLGEAGALLIATAYVTTFARQRRLLHLPEFIDARAWSLGLVAIVVSDWICRPWGLFTGPSIRGELLVGALTMSILLRRGWCSTFFSYWPIVSAAILMWSFWIASDGSLLFSDDHAMFIFRLKLLKENFPFIPFWSPLWNAGFDARDFFATGTLNAFLLSAPFIYSFPVESVYNALIATLLWVFLPSSVFAAGLLLGVSRLGASIAATLSLCSGLFWYRWSLKYGTIGFIVSSTLVPLVLGLAIRFIQYKRPHKRLCISLAVVTSLTLLWSPSGIALLPLAVCALPTWRQIFSSRRHLLTLLLIVAINAPWMMMMWKVSKVGNFLSAERSAHTTSQQSTPTSTDISQGTDTTSSNNTSASFRHRSGSIDPKKSLNQWHNNASALNPLLVIFALPALLSLSGLVRVALSLLAGWLLLLGTVGVSLKPQLELDRMVVLASILLTIPIGSFMSQLFGNSTRGMLWRISGCVAGSFLLIGPFAASSMVLGRSDERYRFASPDVSALASIIHDNAADGRVVFTGCVLHELSGGHLGPLPMWSGVPMVASSYAHNIWRYEQPIPKSLLDRGDSGIQEYLNLQNATLVVAHEPIWIEYFRARPTEYRRISQVGDFFIFSRVGYTSSYALAGEIRELATNSSSISFIPTTERVALKFKYFPFLKSSACSLEPYTATDGLTFIQLTNCPSNQVVTIRSISPVSRLLSTSN